VARDAAFILRRDADGISRHVKNGIVFNANVFGISNPHTVVTAHAFYAVAQN